MAKHLLDTSAILAHARGEPGATAVQALLADREVDLLIASASLPELGRRLRTLGVPAAEILTTLDAYASFAEVVAIDRRSAMRALELIETCSTRLPMVDALIAGTAREHGAILVHRDAHMAAIPLGVLEQRLLAPNVDVRPPAG